MADEWVNVCCGGAVVVPAVGGSRDSLRSIILRTNPNQCCACVAFQIYCCIVHKTPDRNVRTPVKHSVNNSSTTSDRKPRSYIQSCIKDKEHCKQENTRRPWTSRHVSLQHFELQNRQREYKDIKKYINILHHATTRKNHLYWCHHHHRRRGNNRMQFVFHSHIKECNKEIRVSQRNIRWMRFF